MTVFALGKPWWGMSRRELAIDEARVGPTLTVTVPEVRAPFTIPTSAIATCVVLGAPSQRPMISRIGPTGEFDQALPDGRRLARRPRVVDLSSAGVPTLALLLDPPQVVPKVAYGRQAVDSISWSEARAGRARVDVVLCSPVEPDAVARALASVGVSCSDDADLASVQHFGLAEQRAIPEPAVIPRRRRVLIGASLTIGVLAAASLLPAFAWFRPYVGGAALINSLAVLARQRR